MKKRIYLLVVLLLVSTIVTYYFSIPENVEESEAAAPSFWRLSPTTRLMARTISAEARGEPFVGQVAVGAVIMNRVRNSKFPNTISGVIYQPWAFTAVARGHIWSHTPSSNSVRAAISAMNGWDPTYGSIYYYNPAGVSTYWIYSRDVVRRIGKHIFAR
ncbi:cell wall hydrolase [Halanaerobacter jeridensis]|uniref:N-acetylmuramoyl-L-alanine amidase n=1 Tax=Halanaerobacter jeridensis TaxID=706427 RepID=A0A938XYJ2_9FIRM|nr:cell wall hydrolase [Halanaerobacter jeridensis]MBM7558047.1 N-acetylmuramoyl-L-alanine amidase [Halanaerobacter jeridensis]